MSTAVHGLDRDLNFESAWDDEEHAVLLGRTGCSRQTIWRDRDGGLEFWFNLDPSRKGLDAELALARDQARAIVAALPAGWKAKACFREACVDNEVLQRHDPTADR